MKSVAPGDDGESVSGKVLTGVNRKPVRVAGRDQVTRRQELSGKVEHFTC